MSQKRIFLQSSDDGVTAAHIASGNNINMIRAIRHNYENLPDAHNFFIYSVLNASTGLSLDAFQAG